MVTAFKACNSLVYYTYMKTTVLRYNVLLKKEGKQFVAYVPTLGISDFGKTLDDAKKHVHDAIACHVEGLVKTKTEVPAPDTQDFYISQTEITAPKGIKLAF